MTLSHRHVLHLILSPTPQPQAMLVFFLWLSVFCTSSCQTIGRVKQFEIDIVHLSLRAEEPVSRGPPSEEVAKSTGAFHAGDNHLGIEARTNDGSIVPVTTVPGLPEDQLRPDPSTLTPLAAQGVSVDGTGLGTRAAMATSVLVATTHQTPDLSQAQGVTVHEAWLRRRAGTGTLVSVTTVPQVPGALRAQVGSFHEAALRPRAENSTVVSVAMAQQVSGLLQGVGFDETSLGAKTEKGAVLGVLGPTPLAMDRPVERWRRANCSHGPRFTISTYTQSLAGPIHWEELPEAVQADYTLNWTIQIQVRFFRQWKKTRKGIVKHPIWRREDIEEKVARARTGVATPGKSVSIYGVPADIMFFRALKDFPVAGLSVLVVGSQAPWLEAFCIAGGASSITTVDFIVPEVVDYPAIKAISIDELEALSETYDVIMTYSSLEHDGLGRYGDPLHPWGDIERMQKLQCLGKPNSKLFLGVPVGPDYLVFNAHRIYGPVRFPMLIQGWNLLKTYGRESLQELYNLSGNQHRNPLHVLELAS